ncbi:MAG TPA: hypothetical protein VI669_08760 [Vicinamibacteria bacterium]
MIRIGAPILERDPGGDTLAADVGGRRLWFKAPPHSLPGARVEPFLVASLLGAMAGGETLEVDPGSPVSPRLLLGLERIQGIFHAWNPRLSRIAIQATPGAPPPTRDGVASFFSGGVDATYTLLAHEREISHLVFVHGLEITLANEVLFARALAKNQESADRYAKVLVPVKTNLRDFASAHNLSNYLYQGSLLGAVALALGFPRTYLAASLHYADLCPWGTHPLLDPLWSTEGSEILHDGAEASRALKIARLGEREGALESLRVCLANREDYNCGVCEKCLRTMIALRVLGLSSPAFPPLRSLRPIRRLRIHDQDDLPLFLENHALALEKGDHAVARAIGASIRRHRIRQILKLADEAFAGGFVLRTWRRLRHPEGEDDPILPRGG